MENLKATPENKDVEKALLGVILTYSEAIPIALERLKPEYFYTEQHSRLYRVIQTMASGEKPQPIDVLSVTLELKAKGLLGTLISAYDLTILTNGNLHDIATNFSFFCDELINLYVRRQLIKEFFNIYASVSNLDVSVIDLINVM